MELISVHSHWGIKMNAPRGIPGEAFGRWLKSYRWPIFFALLYAILVPIRGFWSPDEPDFAQAVREMVDRKEWVFPYFNGLIYTEKPILFYWLMKISNAVAIGLGGQPEHLNHLIPWALRLPSVLSSIFFLFFMKRWVHRFFSEELSDRSVMILGVLPLWLWQSQYIQIDMLFSVLLASSWMQWISAYLLENGLAPYRHDNEVSRLYQRSIVLLSLATLTKGPLAPVLSIAVVVAFLLTQGKNFQLKQFKFLGLSALFLSIVLPWYVLAIYQAGWSYGYYLIIYQNIERALRAWDHIQPWWKYFEYALGDLFPWSFLLIPGIVNIFARKENRSPIAIFISLCFLVPFVLLSLSESKQGKYLLMSFPFAAIIVAGFLDESQIAYRKVLRRLSSLTILITPLILLLVFLGLALRTQDIILIPVLPSIFYQPATSRFIYTLLTISFLGLVAVAYRLYSENLAMACKELCVTLALVFLGAGYLGFPIIEPLKSFKEWGDTVRPIINGHSVYFWRTVRGGALLYTNQSMREIHTRDSALQIIPGNYLVTMASDWADAIRQPLGSELLPAFESVTEVSAGSDRLILLRRK